MTTPVNPPKLRLMSMADHGQTLTAQFNPSQLEFGISAVWNKMVIPGMGYELLQYSHTENLAVPFDLFFRVSDPKPGVQTEAAKRLGNPTFSTSSITQNLVNVGSFYPGEVQRFTLQQRREAEAFLTAHCYPREGQGVRASSPASVLVVWPQYLSFIGVIRKVNFRVSEFNSTGAPVVLTASVQMEELRDVQYTDMDALHGEFDRAGQAFVPGA